MKKVFLCMLLFFALCFSIFSINVSAETDEVANLFNYFVKQYPSEKVNLIISEKPDQTGFFKEAYLEAKGVVVNNMRFDSAVANVSDLQLNPPSEWANNAKNVKFDSFKSAALTVNILENDINSALKNKEFSYWLETGNIISNDDWWHEEGRNVILHDISVKIAMDQITITGRIRDNGHGAEPAYIKYAAAWLLGPAAADYPFEISSKLKISDDKELWLDNPTVKKGNYSEIDSYIEKNITKRNKPLLKLDELEIFSRAPITLHSVELKDGRLTASSNTLPHILENGITYKYPANSSEDESISPDVPPTSRDVSPVSPDTSPTSGDNSGGSEVISRTPEKPKMDITQESVIETIFEAIRALGGRFENLTSGNTLISDITTDSTVTIGKTRTENDVSSSDVPAGEEVAAVLNEMTITVAKIYVFNISLSNLEVGAPIFWHSVPKDASTGMFRISAEDETEAAVFFDENGNETTVVPASKTVDVAVYLEPGEYKPIITTEAKEDTDTLGSSSGTCNAFSGIYALAALAGLFAIRRRK